MIKRIEHLINFILWTTSLLVLYSCNHDHAVQEQLNTAETLLENKPDSALTVLNGLTNSSIHATKETAARYALLKSMALDKCLIDTTTFDVLQPALDYYIKNGTPDEQLRTYYYQGRIYQNRGDDDTAMRSFMNACDLKQDVTDSLLLAHTLVAQGTLYLKQYKINEFVKNNIEAAKLYEAIDKQFFEIKSYSNALDGYIMQNNQTAADSLLSICIPLVQKNPDGEAVFFSSILSYTVEFCSSDAIKAFLDNYQDFELT